jgi:hypothetical protein
MMYVDPRIDAAVTGADGLAAGALDDVGVTRKLGGTSRTEGREVAQGHRRCCGENGHKQRPVDDLGRDGDGQHPVPEDGRPCG